MVRVRGYRQADEEGVLALWGRAGINRPWLDLRAEIAAKRRRDRSLFVVAVEGAGVVGAVMGAYDGRRWSIRNHHHDNFQFQSVAD